MRAKWLPALALAAIPGAGCETSKTPPERAVPTASASSAPQPETAAPEPPRRQLAARQTVDAKAVAAARPDVLAALTKAHGLTAQKKAKDALEVLAGVEKLDPLGAVLALETSRSALAADDAPLATRSAERALASAIGSEKLVAQAQKALEAAKSKASGGAAPSSALAGPFKTLDEVCAAITRELGQGHVELPSGLSRKSATCAPDYALDLGTPELSRATALRVEAKGEDGADILSWVALTTDKGIVVDGPVDRAYAPSAYSLTNDFTVDLQKIDVLPGKSPEVVVRLDERRSVLDVALNEQVTLDRTEVFILTTDRGKLERSRSFVLSEKVLRDTVDPKDLRLPAGVQHATHLGKGSEYEMKVSWTGPNSVTLTRFMGNAEPRDQGALTLFP